MNENLHNCVLMLKDNQRIKIEGHIGYWSVIDDFRGYVLLEHNTYGDETCYFVAKANKCFFDESVKYQNSFIPCFKDYDVYETYDDIETALNDYDLI